jgi:adenine-specific DNA-methyltransferase
MKNILLKSENIKGLKYLLEEENLAGKIDLIYTDPPFATNCDFTITNGRANTISNSARGEIAYTDHLLGDDFVEYIRERLVLMRELLSNKGSIYLHTDYKIGHYLKVMMDDVFGIDNFRNDITRVKCNPKNFKRVGYGNIKDMILFYTKSSKPIWNEPKAPYSQSDIERLFKKVDSNGRRYTTVPIHAPGETLISKRFKGMLPPEGRHWRTDVSVLEEWDKQGLIEWSVNGNPRKIVYADEKEGKRVQDIWEYKDPQYPIYPTEKNMDMIKLIIKTSSNINSIVLDPFCGSGTTLAAAASCSRKWIGIDKSDLAIDVSKKRMQIGQNILMDDSSVFVDLESNKNV